VSRPGYEGGPVGRFKEHPVGRRGSLVIVLVGLALGVGCMLSGSLCWLRRARPGCGRASGGYGCWPLWQVQLQQCYRRWRNAKANANARHPDVPRRPAQGKGTREHPR
jgi:hypothetical protein